MQRKMKFALFGNTYQEHKSAHVTHLLEILRRKEAHICIHREFYEFLRLHTNADLTNLEIFNGHDFTADMALSVGGDGTFLKTASLVGNKEIPILGINTGRLGFLADISPDQMEETFENDMKLSHELTLEAYNRRSLIIRLKEVISRLLTDIL